MNILTSSAPRKEGGKVRIIFAAGANLVSADLILLLISVSALVLKKYFGPLPRL
jgi:hypothetical protein